MSKEPTLASGDSAASLKSSESALYKEMLSRMVFIRKFEEKVQSLTRTNPPQVAGSVHLCAGQEAVPVGTLAALNEDDQILATYRGHGWAIASDVDPTELLAEICHRKHGLNGGRAGSAYLMAPHTRFIGETSIVGAGTTIACGVALANLYRKNDRVVVASIGDGAMNQGAVHEAMAFAAARYLPVIFVCENNGWSEMTPTADMVRPGAMAQRGNGYGIAAFSISGVDPMLVRDTIWTAAKQCRDGSGPVLVECLVPRLWGHYNRDIEHYRPGADKRAAAADDPIAAMENRLILAGLMTADEVEEVRKEQEASLEEIAKVVLASPLPDPSEAARHMIAEPAATELPSALPTSPNTEELTYVKAVNRALRAELEGDSSTILFGEDVGYAGGIFGATRYLQQEFGANRVFDTPIAENAILGSAIGAALTGLKPIVEIMWADFIFVALDQLVNQAANIRYITQGRSSVPMVVRTQQGATPGSCAQHSRSIEAILAHIPGLKVALAATPNDAHALLRSAAADPDPCVIIEARELYLNKGPVTLDPTPEPVGRARLHRTGGDAAIVTWGTMLHRALEAAEALGQEGIDVSVLDLRWLSPLDHRALESVVRGSGGRVVVVHDAVRTSGFGAEIVASVQELYGDALKVSVQRICAPDVCMPASPLLSFELIPKADDIVRAIRKMTLG